MGSPRPPSYTARLLLVAFGMFLSAALLEAVLRVAHYRPVGRALPPRQRLTPRNSGLSMILTSATA